MLRELLTLVKLRVGPFLADIGFLISMLDFLDVSESRNFD